MQSKAIYYRGINWTKYRVVEKKGGGGGKIYIPKILASASFVQFCAKISPVTLTFRAYNIMVTGINIFFKKRFPVLSSYFSFYSFYFSS